MEVWTGYVTEYSIAYQSTVDCPVDRIADISAIQGAPGAGSCPYALGASLFLDLSKALGEQEFRARFGRLYTMIAAADSVYLSQTYGDIWLNSPETGNYCDYCGGVDPGLYFVRRAFMDGASPEIAHIANHIISHWYYGPAE